MACQVRVFKPDGEDSYDMTAYMDPDGMGYLIRSVGNVFLGISALTSDFLDTTGICSRGPRVRPCLVILPVHVLTGTGCFGAVCIMRADKQSRVILQQSPPLRIETTGISLEALRVRLMP